MCSPASVYVFKSFGDEANEERGVIEKGRQSGEERGEESWHEENTKTCLIARCRG